MKRILIVYKYYLPAKKAGGIVSSLLNLVNVLDRFAEVKILCSNSDLDNSVLEVDYDQWIKRGNIDVFYASRLSSELLNQIEAPDVVYINGFYMPDYFLLPLSFYKRKAKVIVAPRGMFQEGALAVKPLKKRVFIFLFKLMKWHKNIIWHATDNQEAKDIKSLFPQSEVKLAFDTPSPSYEYELIKKEEKSLKLVFLSLITEKKNLLFLLDLIETVEENVSLDIFGPVKDQEYWRKCKNRIDQLDNTNYKGELSPDEVPEVIKDYHLFVLPTYGENFGHAIYESFAAGRPVLISEKTPWKNLESTCSGYDISLSDKKVWFKILDQFYHMDQEEYNEWCKGAQNKAKSYWETNNFEDQYRKLFSI